jgi:RNA polymerase sigma-70 factor (ECF subfamily)
VELVAAMDRPAESALVDACRARRTGGLERLIEENYDRVFRVALTLARHEEDARDLTQQTFLAAIRAIDRFEGQSSLFTWLVAILRNTFAVSVRHRGLTGPLEDEPPPERPADGPDRDRILAAVARLPERLRTVIVLFHLENLSYDEIAKAVDCPVGTVRSRLHEARGELKRWLS